MVENNNRNETRHGNAGFNRNDDSSNRDLRPRRKRIRKPSEEDNPLKITQERPLRDKNDDLRLNKYISRGGVCSRREADEMIAGGKVEVNGEVITTLGHRVKISDEVKVNGKIISPNSKVYILLNKPKDYITTTHDPSGRKTVMDLIGDVDAERVFPVGRLDRNTTGILIFTNDGDLAQALMHPKGNVNKIYSVQLDKPIEKGHFLKLQNGIKLFDGFMKPDKIALVNSEDKTKLGVQIHSGRNRVVRRMFEALGYEVVKLDRVIYAGIDKKGLERGKWRELTENEILQLKRITKVW
ncbi:MAG: rRNA pseudouridine synthase [Flavobacteriales bacterium]|nr:rRNA pseudouridine synthase [Flavobacteriales bacterium]